MISEVFQLYMPKDQPIRGLISIPHAGESFPEEFIPYLTSDKRALAEDVDFAVDQLVDIKRLVDNGVIVIVANVHRTCLDLNRHPDQACLNWVHNTQGTELVTTLPDDQLKHDLTVKYHTPYYNKLTELITTYSTSQRKLPVIDLHSMPSKPTAHHLKQNPNQKKERADSCISDLRGKSCDPEYIDEVIKFLHANEVGAAKNDPYFGGYLTQYMNDLECNNIQIELNRKIYMDEVTRELLPVKVEKLRPILTELVLNIFTKF